MQTTPAIPWDLLLVMQRHAEMVHLLLCGTEEPGRLLTSEIHEAVAERTALAVRELRRERRLEQERGELTQEAEDRAYQLETLMAQLNGLANVCTAGCNYINEERYAVPEPSDWWDGLRRLGDSLAPYLDAYEGVDADKAAA